MINLQNLKKELVIWKLKRKNSFMSFKENIEYSKDWLLKEIIKTDFEEKRTKQIQYVQIKKIDLLRLVQKFIKLNERGDK